MHLLRKGAAQKLDDLNLLLFESAVGEIGANVLTHGLAGGDAGLGVEYSLSLEGDAAVASFTDRGPPLHNQLARAMPAPTTERGRGLAIARAALDELAYAREGEVNTWRLMKRL